jgi:5-formyltetrahydrofolate cyclo-ligase
VKKEELRKIYKQKRLELSQIQIDEYQENIYHQIQQLNLENVEYVHLFLSLKKFKEVDTQPIVKYFKSRHKKIVLSKSNFKDYTLTHFLLEENTKLSFNKYGIPEPENGIEIQPKQLDLVFVPLLISDQQNYRVGYGKGFYDRFLSDCRKDCKSIGLNFFPPIAKIEDVNEFDIALNKVIYPKLEIS